MACPEDDNSERTVQIKREETLQKELQRAKDLEACLIVIRGPHPGSRFFLNQNEMILGRDPGTDISLDEPSVSRKHVKFIREAAGTVRCVDLGSSNGTFINDRRLKAGDTVVLEKEDMIKLGSAIVKFLPAGELEIVFFGNLGSAAHMDGLTQIYNKRYLTEALEAEFKRAKALHTDFSFVMFDLDHFKKVNDTFGHDAGDYVLREVANLVRAFCRPKDIFARYGGEEFVILMGNTPISAANEIAEKIRSAIQTHAFIYEGKRLPVTTSMGIAEVTTEIESSATLLKTADKALYAAKQGGRNRIVVAT